MNQTPVVAALQRSCGEDRTENLDAMLTMVEAALDDGATIVIPQELFQGIYFCQYERQEFFKWAVPAEDSPAIDAVVQLTTGREAVVPVSFFERAGATLFNSVAIVDSGRVLGIYRKTHIPDGPGYEEKFYFTPGDTGFRTWATSHALSNRPHTIINTVKSFHFLLVEKDLKTPGFRLQHRNSRRARCFSS